VQIGAITGHNPYLNDAFKCTCGMVSKRHNYIRHIAQFIISTLMLSFDRLLGLQRISPH
jgi:hypothetical protein